MPLVCRLPAVAFYFLEGGTSDPRLRPSPVIVLIQRDSLEVQVQPASLGCFNDPAAGEVGQLVPGVRVITKAFSLRYLLSGLG